MEKEIKMLDRLERVLLIYRRMAQGKTLAEVAEELGVSRQRVSQIKKDTLSVPMLKSLRAWLQQGVEAIDWVLSEYGDKP